MGLKLLLCTRRPLKTDNPFKLLFYHRMKHQTIIEFLVQWPNGIKRSITADFSCMNLYPIIHDYSALRFIPFRHDGRLSEDYVPGRLIPPSGLSL